MKKMTEYISREAILDDLEKEIEAGNVALDEDVWINKGLRIAIRDIKDIKAADVQPVKRGRWIWKERHRNSYQIVKGIDECGKEGSLQIHEEYKEQINYCSECGKQGHEIFLNFCPNCGARMDE